MWGGGDACWGRWGDAARGRLVGWAVTEEAARRMGSAGRVGGRAGAASLEGLVWLARVGPASVEAWGCAMGWSRSVGFSHAQRLEREGWLARYPMLRGHGSLLVATSSGVRMAGVAVSPARPPAPTWWAHLDACGWVAAWLTVRGRVMPGWRRVGGGPAGPRKHPLHERKGPNPRRASARPRGDFGRGAIRIEVE